MKELVEMIQDVTDSRMAVAAIFNSAIAAPAIATAWELGLLDQLRDQKMVDVHEFAVQSDLDSGSIQGLITALVVVDVVERDQDTVAAGRLLNEAYRSKSLFYWLTRGSGELFSSMQHVLRNKNRMGDFYHRDSAAIAYACRDINEVHFDPAFWTAMREIDIDIRSIVDLGSGSGERLMQILDEYPGTTGIGIDLAGPSIKVAAAEASQRGFGGRLSFIEGDACKMEYRDEFANVNLLTCSMMGHDFWPRENCVETLQRLRKAFPEVNRFLLGDTTRILLDNDGSKHSITEANVPMFTLGSEFGHAMMDVYLPTLEDWEGGFTKGGWCCVKKHLIETQSLSAIFELEPIDHKIEL